MMTKNEIVRQYVEAYPTPRKEYCPRIFQDSRYRKNGISYYKVWDSDTGKIYKYDTQNDEIRALKASDSRSCDTTANTYNNIFTYMVCVPTEAGKMLEISKVRMQQATGKEGETRECEWYPYDKRYFTFENDKDVYDEKGVLLNAFTGKFFNKLILRKIGDCAKLPTCDKTIETFSEWAGTDRYIMRWNNEEALFLNNRYLMAEWYRMNCSERNSRKTETLKEVLKIDLTPLEVLYEKYPKIEKEVTYHDCWMGYGKGYGDKTIIECINQNIVHFEKVNDDWCVLRNLNRRQEYNCETHEYEDKNVFDEKYRVYIDKKGNATLCNKTYKIESPFMVSTSHIDTTLQTNAVFGNPEDMEGWPKLEWLKDIIVDISEGCNPATILVDILRHPIVETMYKAGYSNLTKVILDENTIRKNIETIFGVKEKNKGKLTKILGVNKATLAYLDKKFIPDDKTEVTRSTYGKVRYSYNTTVRMLLKAIKAIYTDVDLTTVSKEFINENYEGMCKILKSEGERCIHMVRPNTRYYSYHTQNWTLNEDERNKMKHLIRMANKDMDIVNTLSDIANMYSSMAEADRPDIESCYKINNAREMQQYHDDVVRIYNEANERRRAAYNAELRLKKEEQEKKYETRKKKMMDKFDYIPEETEYEIIYPRKLVDIEIEGTTLHHCVGGYRTKHAAGQTNILFLRKKNAENIPFYTIEVNDSNEVVQIHGRANRWLGHEESIDLCQFVIDWTKKTGVKCSKDIILETSCGYGATGKKLDEAQFTW